MESYPIIIGGVGGSGTRLFGETLMAAGLRTVRDLNVASDAMACALLFKRPSVFDDMKAGRPFERLWEIMEAGIHGGRKLSKEDRLLLKALIREPRVHHPPKWLRARARRLKKEAAGNPQSGRWFLKEPNLHVVAPKILEMRSDMRFVMAVRHGVDMAFSRNKQQVAVWGPTFLEEPDLEITIPASLRYWCAVHRRMAELQAKEPDRILVLSFDQFCSEPERILRRLFEFSGVELTDELLEKAVDGVKAPPSIGRRHNEDLSIFDPADMEFVESYMTTIESA